MKKEDLQIVYNAIIAHGDDFWTEEPDEGMVSNAHLFDDILEYLNKSGYDLKLVTTEREQIQEREFNLVVCYTLHDLSPAWNDIVGERLFVSGVFVNFGMAEECIGLLELTDINTQELIYEVGVGECLRPYRELYIGKNDCEASKIFIDEINRLKQ